MTAPKDRELDFTLHLTDKKGRQQTREAILYQKGTAHKLIKILSPASERGTGLLLLPERKMYYVKPPMKKAQRIAIASRNKSFAGTDLTYRDIEQEQLSAIWNARLIRTENDGYVLETTLKEGKESPFSKLDVYVQKDFFYITKIEYYEKSGKLSKIVTREKFVQIDGYHYAKETVIEDLKKGHTTKIICTLAKFDSNISDRLFTQEFLMR
jgi:hypothetical protein